MFKRNYSENQDFSFGETLTKFNLTNYKSKNNHITINHNDLLNFKQFSPKKQKSTHKKQKKLNSLNKNWYQAPTFKTLDVQNMLRKRKRKNKSQMKIGVTSRSQRQLIQFMNPQSLPKILIKNALKQSSVQKMIQAANNEKKFRKFTQSYFRSVEKAKVSLQGNQVQQQFGQIKVLGWSVKGYIIKGSLILKGVRWSKNGKILQKKKMQKYKKYILTNEIRRRMYNNYQQLIKQWLYLDQVLSR